MSRTFEFFFLFQNGYSHLSLFHHGAYLLLNIITAVLNTFPPLLKSFCDAVMTELCTQQETETQELLVTHCRQVGGLLVFYCLTSGLTLSVRPPSACPGCTRSSRIPYLVS